MRRQVATQVTIEAATPSTKNLRWLPASSMRPPQKSAPANAAVR